MELQSVQRGWTVRLEEVNHIFLESAIGDRRFSISDSFQPFPLLSLMTDCCMSVYCV